MTHPRSGKVKTQRGLNIGGHPLWNSVLKWLLYGGKIWSEVRDLWGYFFSPNFRRDPPITPLTLPSIPRVTDWNACTYYKPTPAGVFFLRKEQVFEFKKPQNPKDKAHGRGSHWLRCLHCVLCLGYSQRVHHWGRRSPSNPPRESKAVLFYCVC